MVAANGGTPIAITTGTHNDAMPMWTAAGDRLVFSSDLTERRDDDRNRSEDRTRNRRRSSA